MEPRNEVKLNDEVRYIGTAPVKEPAVMSGAIGSVIRIYDDIWTEYGNPVTHLVRFDFDGDLELELVWFNPDDLEVVAR